ncbi:MAG: Smr/MutS family protein, partial [Fimbriimonadaceae bacterium]|nr:Smr/MutS family protein [Chitinophagales bacterium]
RGKAKEEAMMELENFLDKALMRNVFQLRIMHGKGTGVLRTAVQQVLKNYKAVKKYQFEENNMGGDGVTLVEF